MPVEVTDNYIRVRVAMPGDFQVDSYRVIGIDEAAGIKATIGKLLGKDTTSTQNYMFEKDKWDVVRAKKWVTDHGKKIMSDEAEQNKLDFSDNKHTFDLPHVEIFAAGTWNKLKFDVADLDNMVDNFAKLEVRVPMKLGHVDKHKIAQNEVLPALGYVKKIWRDGEKLLADFSEVPKQIVELIKRKAYGRFSVEAIRNYAYRGNIYRNVLTAVALLGDELPAVQTIKDILNLYKDKRAHAYSQEFPADQIFKAYENDGKENDMDNEKERQELKAKLEAEQAKLKQIEQEKIKLQQEIESARDANLKASIDAAIEKGVAEFKIVPASRNIYSAMAYKAAGLVDKVYKFSADNKEKEIDVTDIPNMIVKMTADMPALKSAQGTSDKGKADDAKNKTDDVIDESGKKIFTGKSLDDKAEKIASERKITYAEALDIAIAEEKKED